jgi:tRNA (adenine37-N6)-methyltransferase
MAQPTNPRPGDQHADREPATLVADAGLVFIGRAVTPWSSGDCPKNMAQARSYGARASGAQATLIIDPPWRPALMDLKRASHIILLGWFAGADRSLVALQPPHLARPVGCFALRAPARPNPIGLSIAGLLGVDVATGEVRIDALDWFDGTALIDIKPYYPSTDKIDAATIVEPGPGN